MPEVGAILSQSVRRVSNLGRDWVVAMLEGTVPPKQVKSCLASVRGLEGLHFMSQCCCDIWMSGPGYDFLEVAV